MVEHKFAAGDRVVVTSHWRPHKDKQPLPNTRDSWWHHYPHGAEVTIDNVTTSYSEWEHVPAYRIGSQIVHENDLDWPKVPPLTDEEVAEVRQRLGVL